MTTPSPGHRPSVSVVIPTRDRPRRTAQAVASVLDQTAPAHEVLVVDDGSSPGSRGDLAAELARLAEGPAAPDGPRVELLTQDHAGVSAARNRGIERAQGTWVAFLDSDDLWRPTKLARQLAEVATSGLSIVHCDEIWIRDGRRVNPRRRHRKRGGRIYRHCLPLCCISPSAVMIARQVFARHGTFDESMPACEDYDLWLRLCAHLEVAYTDEPLVVKHGGHPDQLSRTVPALDRWRIHALVKILGDRTVSGEERQATIEMLRRKVEVYGAGARRRGRHDEADALDALVQRVEASDGTSDMTSDMTPDPSKMPSKENGA